ncbi:MAG: hypothetical protein JRI92_11990 [Deltaproteobacteria bacterium]|nr:hypothetical protein [Deltaproteobacteria bacterium]
MDIKSVYKEQLELKENRANEIQEKITPLKQEMDDLNKEVDALKLLIGAEKKSKITPTIKGRLSDMNGMEAYKELSKNYFQDRPFRESEIRKVAIKEGLIIRRKIIGRNTSWGIIKGLYTDGFLVRVDKGVYRYKKPELSQDTNKQEDDEGAQEQHTGRITAFQLDQE